MTGFHASGHGATYVQMGSCTVSFFCSCSLSTSVAVNCLVIEPSRNFVVGVLGTSHSALAQPYPFDRIGEPPRASSTVPLKPFTRAWARR